MEQDTEQLVDEMGDATGEQDADGGDADGEQDVKEAIRMGQEISDET